MIILKYLLPLAMEREYFPVPETSGKVIWLVLATEMSKAMTRHFQA